jgi:ribosomal-protein-alanine N-acetyltransferase
MHIETERFILHQLDDETDDFANYLEWMQDVSANPFIAGTNSNYTMEELRKYVGDKNRQTDCCLLGIFLKTDRKHIGNLKFEPIDWQAGTAWLGILIGDQRWRNVHAAREILLASMDKLSRELDINIFYLGVSAENTAATRSYRSIGFEVDESLSSSAKSDGIIMRKQLSY